MDCILCSTFTDSIATKAFYILPHIHPFIHTAVSCSWTPRHLVRWNRGLNHQPSGV